MPLYEASLRGHKDIIELLLKHGARVDVAYHVRLRSHGTKATKASYTT